MTETDKKTLIMMGIGTAVAIIIATIVFLLSGDPGTAGVAGVAGAAVTEARRRQKAISDAKAAAEDAKATAHDVAGDVAVTRGEMEANEDNVIELSDAEKARLGGVVLGDE